MQFQIAVEGVVNRGPDSPWQVDIGRRDDKRIRIFLVNRHDAVEGMLLFLSPLKVARKIDNLLFMLPDHRPLQGDNASWIFVVDAVTGLAQLLMWSFRRDLHPLPAPFVIDCSAGWAPCGLRQLPPQFVWIANPFVLCAAENSALMYATDKWTARGRNLWLLHVLTEP